MSLVLKDILCPCGTASHIVSGIHPSVSAAYKALEKDLGVSRPALYGKLNGMELNVSQALVRYSASNLESGIAQKGSYFIIRQHKSLPFQEISLLEKIGDSGTGEVFEQQIQITNPDDSTLKLRRVVIQLRQPTRHGDKQVALLTHLPHSVADAETITGLYLKRWSIEGMFQVITDTFNCELNEEVPRDTAPHMR
ncbi:MAG: hypothetical protein AAFQ91_26905, partial [Cyanobacteria bacterium J06621_15]